MAGNPPGKTQYAECVRIRDPDERSTTVFQRHRPFSNTNLGVGTDWQDVLFNDGAPVQNHQLSISGANEKVSYYFSAGYYNQEGIIGGNYDRSNYERLSFRSNTLYTLFDETKNRSWLRK